MSKWSVRLVLAISGGLVLGITPLAPAPQEPGTEYTFTIDEEASYVFVDIGGDGVITDQSPMVGAFSLFLGEPTAGSPTNWDVRCVLGRSNLINTEDIVLKVAPGFVEASILAEQLKLFDMDIWYQDPNDWNVDPNWWPDPNDALDANDAPDPNSIAPGDPNDPNYHDPNDPNFLRWVDLTGGPGVSSGMLNSEVFFFWRYYVVAFGTPEEGASIEWSKPFGPWTVSVADAPLLDPNETPAGEVQATVDWQFWVSGDFAILGTVHLEGACKLYDLSLSLVNPQYGSVAVEPNLPGHPAGSVVVLTAEPIEGKSFNRWVIFDPNYPGDANFGTIDSNLVLYLTMDEDKSVEAAFKCGSGMPPFVAMSLLALAVGVVIRRLT
ncbi:MAG: hypothetical protein JXQ73_28440 [Phycisphaerae bacterium]|nr:hypothetical protein [Phycisphaerae bacterium]